MRLVTKSSVGAVVALLAVSAAATAQTPYHDDLVCRQYAESAIAPYRDQANVAGVGSALVGAGLGAALGAAIGGGRGAGIGAASGAIAGTGVGVANAQQYSGQLQQAYTSYYYSCMQSRQPAGYAQQPAYGQPYAAPQYAPPQYGAPQYGAPQYAPQPAYQGYGYPR